MQSVVNSSSTFPIILEQVFERFLSSNNKEDTENIFLDLNKLLGKVLVQSALHIIDHQKIVVYTNNQKTIEIAEISEIGSSPGIVRLLPHLNYCTCKYFRTEILLRVDPINGPYTCEHVLAMRLAFALRSKCLEFKEIPSYQLDLLLTYLLPEVNYTD